MSALPPSLARARVLHPLFFVFSLTVNTKSQRPLSNGDQTEYSFVLMLAGLSYLDSLGKIQKNGWIYTGDGSSLKTNHPSSIYAGRTMRTSIKGSVNFSVNTQANFRESATKSLNYQSGKCCRQII